MKYQETIKDIKSYLITFLETFQAGLSHFWKVFSYVFSHFWKFFMQIITFSENALHYIWSPTRFSLLNNCTYIKKQAPKDLLYRF